MQTQCFYPIQQNVLIYWKKKNSPTIYNGFFKKSSEN